MRERRRRLGRFGADEALHRRRIMWDVQRGLVALRRPARYELDYWLGRRPHGLRLIDGGQGGKGR